MVHPGMVAQPRLHGHGGVWLRAPFSDLFP